LIVLLTLPARGADASPWDAGSHSAVRLIAGGAVKQAEQQAFRAGIEVKLAKGWKTYWRYPGDSGIPPTISFQRSENVRQFFVAWPAPQRLIEDGSTSIGYARDIIFPVKIIPHDPKKPVLLRLDISYAVCEKICIPAEAKAELLLTGDAGAQEARLADAEARVPKTSSVGKGSDLAIRAVYRERSEPGGRVIADVSFAGEGTEVDLFAEGPTAEWALPLPEPIAGAPPGMRRFAFALEGLPPGARAEGAMLRLTAVAGQRAVEVFYRLD
jgi:DsbC/DsbD-like thiol-disulfide interchange protein